MRGVRVVKVIVVAVMMAMTVTLSPLVAAQDATEPPEFLPVSPLIISAYSVAGEQPRYIELYNDGDELLRPEEWSVSVVWALRDSAPTGSIVPEVAPISLYIATDETVPYIPPGGYVVVGFNDVVTNALSKITLDGLSDYSYVKELRIQHEQYRLYARSLTQAQAVAGSTMRLNIGTTGYTTTYGNTNSDKIYQDADYYYAPTGGFPLVPIEVLANPKTCSPTDTSTDCLEYVKFYNGTTDTISFDDVRLRAGSSVIPLSGSVASGEYAVFTVALANTGGYVSLEDKYGIHTFENTVTEYPDAGVSSKKGLSWALIDDTWQWATPNPGGANTPLPVVEEVAVSAPNELKPCRADQYRNPETNRCKLIASSNSTLTPCASNQYRNPETNRCRLIASTSSSSSLKPCAANQYRNPETNRCKLIASAASQLKPCAANQERNPATNRCRNVLASTIPTADYPVEETEVQPEQSLGWVAFAGVATIALGYAGWEWRYEIAGIFRRLKGLVIRQ